MTDQDQVAAATSRYDEVYADWQADPQAFWARAAEAIDWHRRWDRVLDDSRPPFYRWYPGARLNITHNALDRHVDGGRADQPALIHDSPVSDSKTTFSYRQLRDEVALAAGALRALGVERGDRVVLYLPMIPEAVIAMLACARIGAIHSVVFGGFAAPELAARIDDARPRAIVSASCGLEPGRVIAYKPLLDRAIELSSSKPDRCLIVQRPQQPAQLVAGRDINWREALAAAEPADPVMVEATDPLYILYTSGTTGRPKGIVRDTGGYAVALRWSVEAVFGVAPGEVLFTASDVGWVVGHSYIVYAPLLAGATTILYEGKPVGTPDAGAFWRVAAEHGAKVLFTAPTAFRAIKREDPQATHVGRHDLSRFRALFLAGERCDPDTLRWAERALQRPVIDNWWQTETGWPIVSNCLGLGLLPVKAGSPTKSVPGYDVRVLDDDGRQTEPSQPGNIVIRLPMPPGTLPTLYRDDEGYQRGYLERYPGYYLSGDAGFRDEDGYLYVMSRIDDVINVAGHRLSTGAMEEVIASHPDVAECAVFGVADALKGQLPVGLAVLKAGVARPAGDITRELVALVRERIGPVASFKTAAIVKRLPKTRSGKILRGTMAKLADGGPYTVPATIDDPAILDEIAEALTAARGA
jgi:propionyl-CoA synthetase